MNVLLKLLMIFSLSFGGMIPLYCTTWYSQNSGLWGDGGDPGLWNTDPNGLGITYDGTDLPTVADDIVIQSSHLIELGDFAAVANQLDIHTLTVEQDGELYGSAAVVLSIHGAAVTVDGAINYPTLTVVSSPTASFNTLTGTGAATLEALSFKHSLPTNAISIDLNISLQTDFYPFDALGTVVTGNVTVEKNKTLSVLGSIFLDADAANGFALNNYESDSDLIVKGTLSASGMLKIGSDNIFSDLLVQVDAGALLQLAGAIEGGAALWAATSIVNVEGTLATSAVDPIQDMNVLFFVRMNANSLCRLEGGANQLLDADLTPAVYYDVELAGSGPKLLAGSVEIANELDLGTTLILDNYNLYLSKMFVGGFFSTGIPVVNYSVNAFIETNGTGQLRMWIPGAGFGSSNTIIPVGRGNFTPLIVTNSSTSTSYFDIHVDNGVNPAGAGTTTKYVNKTWRFEPATTFSAPLNIQFFWNDIDEQANFERNASWPAHYNGTIWDIAAPQMADLLGIFGGPQYEVLRTGITDFGAFSIASDGLLPVELLEFRAVVTDRGHALHWRTASELNNSHFEVEYSVDGWLYTPIGWVSGKGTTPQPTTYDWLHQSLTPANHHYYRLKQVDLDGQFTYSKVISLEPIASLIPRFRIYPNPATDVLHFQIPSGGRAFDQIHIFSIDGRRVWQHAVAPGDLVDLSLAHWKSGAYRVFGSSGNRALQALGRFVKP